MPLQPDRSGPVLAPFDGGWDCHVHVFGSPDHRPVAQSARYLPAQACSDSLRRHLKGIGARRCVLIQPSVYGFDNQCLLEALDALGKDARAVMALEPTALDDAVIADLHARGARGVRINPGGRVTDLASVERYFDHLADRLNGTGWHIEIHALPGLATRFVEALGARRVRLVFDHVFALDPRAPDFEDASRSVLALGEHCAIWTKISGLDRVCPHPEARSRMDDVLARLLEHMPDRTVWGSDWPHTPLHGARDHQGFRRVDAELEARSTIALACDGGRALFVHNPAALYDVLPGPLAP